MIVLNQIITIQSFINLFIADLRLTAKLIVTIQCENFNQEATSSAVRRGCANGDDKLIDLRNINKITIRKNYILL